MESEGQKLLHRRWKRLSPRTIVAKMRLGFGNTKILERTGKLRRGIKERRLTRTELVIGNKVKYYKYHQLGGGTLPQRQMLGVNRDIEKIVMNEFKKEISFT